MNPISRQALLIFGVAALVGSASATAQSSSTDTVTASANIMEGIALQRTADLNFGDIAPSAVGGSVTVPPAGLATSAGGVTAVNNPANPPQAAAYDVLLVGNAGSKKFWTQLPADGTVTISNGLAVMQVNNFTANLACAQTSATAPAPGACPQAPNVLQVGATLAVGANQPVGFYSGTFQVTVHRF